jgi:hypothetical protein
MDPPLRRPHKEECQEVRLPKRCQYRLPIVETQ